MTASAIHFLEATSYFNFHAQLFQFILELEGLFEGDESITPRG